MRITWITPGLTLSGGMLAVCGFANGFAERGHTVTLVAPRVPRDELVGFISPSVRIVLSRSDICPRAGSHIRNGILATDLALVTPRSDVLIGTYAPTAIPTLIAATLGRGEPFWYYADYPEMFAQRSVERWIIRELPARFRKVLTNSHVNVRELRELAGVDATYVGLGLPRWDHLSPPSADAIRPPVALWVGDARPRKGIDDFFAALEIARPLLPELRAVLATKDPVERRASVPTEVVERPDSARLAELYRTCGVFVSTSWSESLGLPPLEAMACGAPVVTTATRGARDYARDGENCLIVPTHAPGRVAEAIARILADPRLGERLGQNGLRTAEDYRWPAAIDRFELALATWRGRADRG